MRYFNFSRCIRPAFGVVGLILACLFILPSASHASDGVHKQISRGKASWYGTTAHGKRTASGDIFRRTDFSAAHRTLPFGTVIRVHHARTGRQVLVRINDRGPFVKGRVVDVSKRAADNLRIINSGVASVVYEVVTDTKGRPLNPENGFYVRLMETDSIKEALEKAPELETRLGLDVRTLVAVPPRKMLNLCVGPFETFKEAEKTLAAIEPAFKVKDIVEGPAQGGPLPFYAIPGTVGAGQKADVKSASFASSESKKVSNY